MIIFWIFIFIFALSIFYKSMAKKRNAPITAPKQTIKRVDKENLDKKAYYYLFISENSLRVHWQGDDKQWYLQKEDKSAPAFAHNPEHIERQLVFERIKLIKSVPLIEWLGSNEESLKSNLLSVKEDYFKGTVFDPNLK